MTPQQEARVETALVTMLSAGRLVIEREGMGMAVVFENGIRVIRRAAGQVASTTPFLEVLHGLLVEVHAAWHDQVTEETTRRMAAAKRDPHAS